MIVEAFKGFFLLFLILVPLERFFALHPQKIFRPGWITDGVYYLTGYFIGRSTLWLISSIFLAYFLKNLINPNLQNFIANQPVWLQLIQTIIIGELGYYTAHRLTHSIPWLWKFHSIHHSGKHIDWLAAVRAHPLDQIFVKICQIFPIYLLGYNQQTLTLFALFSAFEAFFIHANLNLKLGFLNYILVTPQLHRWHHNLYPETHHKNFAAQLPIIDIIFGTFYLPPNKKPQNYGISQPVPSTYFGQLLYPFQKQKYPD
ncbi:sterol desaturase family protein [Ancylothrix sp. C2]|uniref:sterol desaturase family protein n=1 Tax=Ancylothrix sp. D3o TaxID=2953691 RepID=UPI0021BAF7FB|nr:sterol desaturase family protein [Ancylothrix sp. D3o]MCT7950609.1 sterol desaturase family protein [Ancylothrix sp. D3o]